MKYYSEEEVKKVLMERERYTDFGANDIIGKMIPSTPTIPDRERIRMELWKEVYLQASKDDNYTADIYSIDAKDALEEFDKQFPNVVESNSDQIKITVKPK